MKRIIFFTSIERNNRRTSSDIMTDNLILGLSQNNYEVLLVAVNQDSDEEFVRLAYSDLPIKVLYQKSKIKGPLSRYRQLWSLIRLSYSDIKLSPENLQAIERFLDRDTILLTHSPSVEAACYCRSVRRKHGCKWIQYWSDPIALSGIIPEAYNWKRIPFRRVEKHLLNMCDEIVYGTQTLYHFQSRFYPEFRNKMRWIDVSYCPKISMDRAPQKQIRIVYSGNYYSPIRNILPLYDAFASLPAHFHLDIYGNGDTVLPSTPQVTVHARVDSDSIRTIEAQADMLICLLNRNCFQVPGKVFYNTASDQEILVLLDGPEKKIIRSHLEPYGRFFFCENDSQAIANFFHKHQPKPVSVPAALLDRLSSKTVSKALVEGR